MWLNLGMWKAFLLVFASVFLAEIGDKTQIATFTYATRKEFPPWAVFGGASLALLASTAVAFFVGHKVGTILPVKVIRVTSGLIFILMGIWCILRS